MYCACITHAWRFPLTWVNPPWKNWDRSLLFWCSVWQALELGLRVSKTDKVQTWLHTTQQHGALDVSILYYVFIWEDTAGRSWMKLLHFCNTKHRKFPNKSWTFVKTRRQCIHSKMKALPIPNLSQFSLSQRWLQWTPHHTLLIVSLLCY